MDPELLKDLSVNLVAAGAYALLAGVVRKARIDDELEGNLADRLREDPTLSAAMEAATATVAEYTGVDELRSVLQSPSAAAVVRQLYAVRLTGEDTYSIDDIAEEFVRLVASHLQMSQAEIREQATLLFKAISQGTNVALQLLIDQEVLSAHELTSVRRHNILLGELQSIKALVELARSRAKPDIAAISKFEEEYRSQVMDWADTITPPNFDAVRQIPIDDLYVEPNLLRSVQSSSGEDVPIDGLLSEMHRVVCSDTQAVASQPSVRSSASTWLVNPGAWLNVL